ncbi:MAG: hypothetical protein AB7E47_04775 [Desulfovibrionaceae bacterium]
MSGCGLRTGRNRRAGPACAACWLRHAWAGAWAVLLFTLAVAPGPALGAEFSENSAVIDNPWFNVARPGDFLIFKGYGNYAPFVLREYAAATSHVDGVACLEIQRMLMPRDNADSAKVFLTYCVAQDTMGNVLALRENDAVFGARDAHMILPAVPAQGLEFGRFHDNIKRVADANATITLAHADKTYGDCLRIEETLKDDHIIRYHARGVGMVFMGEGDNTFELSYAKRTP